MVEFAVPIQAAERNVDKPAPGVGEQVLEITAGVLCKSFVGTSI